MDHPQYGIGTGQVDGQKKTGGTRTDMEVVVSRLALIAEQLSQRNNALGAVLYRAYGPHPQDAPAPGHGTVQPMPEGAMECTRLLLTSIESHLNCTEELLKRLDSLV